jgi:hypothetical protein
VKFDGLVARTALRQECCEVAAGERHLGMFRSENAAQDAKRAPIAPLRLRGAAGKLMECCEIGKVESDLEMHSSERTLENEEGTEVEGLGFDELAPPAQNGGQRRDVRGDGRVFASENSLADGDGAAGQGLALCEAPARVLEATEIVKDGRGIEGANADRVLDRGERAAVQPFGAVVASGELADNPQVVRGARDLPRRETAPCCRESALVRSFGEAVFAAGQVERAQLSEGLCAQASERDVAPQRFEDIHRTLNEGNRDRILAAVVMRAGQFEQHVRDIRVIGPRVLLEERERSSADTSGGSRTPLGTQLRRLVVHIARRVDRIVRARQRTSAAATATQTLMLLWLLVSAPLRTFVRTLTPL